MILRARACVKCRTYVVIHPENPINQREIKRFEKEHVKHTIMTVGLGEIKGLYSPFKNNEGVKPIKKSK